MIHSQWEVVLAKACEGTAFKPGVRTDIQTIGHKRYYDGWIVDTRTGEIFSSGSIDFNQTPEQGLKELKVKLARLEARLLEYRSAVTRNKERLVR